METPRTKITVTPVDLGIPLRRVWASKLLMDLRQSHPVGTEIPLTTEGIELFKTVLQADWTYNRESVDINLEQGTITILR